MNKIERLISIIMILLKKEIVSAKEFSQLFGVSKRTILRDMETLSLSNIPIYAIYGVNGGFGIMDEYKFDKRLLSNSDLENILIALSGLEQILISEEVEITLKKVESIVGPRDINNAIRISFYDWEGRLEIINLLKVCQEAIYNRKLISFEYIDKEGNKTTRTIEPYQLQFNELSWYLKGFCLQRLSYRTFKLSRIEHLRLSEQSFSVRNLTQEDVSHSIYEPELVKIQVLIANNIKDQFIERYGRKNINYFNSELSLATIYVPQNNIGFQFLASFGILLEVIAPLEFITEFKIYLTRMVEKYSH